MTIQAVELERPLPQAPDSERAVLGSILINSEAFDRVVPFIAAGDFFHDAHKAIWASMSRLVDGRIEIDLHTLKDDLGRRQELEKVGGSAYISSLVDGIPDVANVERYARMVREKSLLRSIIIEGNRVMRLALDSDETAGEISAGSALRLTDLASSRESGPISVRLTVRRAAADIEARSVSHEHITGVPFGLPNLDGYTLGIQRGVESMLAARPRVGKTAFALAIALANAKAKRRTLFIELDMSEQMIGKRLLAAESGVSYEKIRSGQYIAAEEWRLIAEAEARLANLDGWLLFDYSTHDIAQISALIRREARRSLDLVIVDHVGHVDGVKADRRDLEIGKVSRRFIDLAKETGAALLPLVQLKRDAEHREPNLSDLAECGKLEQDARLVVMLDRPFLRSEPAFSACRLNLFIPKNEGEAGGKLEAHFDGDIQRVSQEPTQRCRYCPIGPRI